MKTLVILVLLYMNSHTGGRDVVVYTCIVTQVLAPLIVYIQLIVLVINLFTDSN